MPLFDNCQGRWKLANAIWTDSSGNGNTLTASTSAPTATTGFYGGANLAANFVRATPQYLSRTDALQVGLDLSGAFTIAGHIKLVASNDGNYYMICSKLAGTSYAYDFYIADTGKLTARFSINGTAIHVTVTGATILSPGVWYNVAAKYDASTLKVYLGTGGSYAEDGTATPGSQVIFNSTLPFAVGVAADLTSHNMNGVIDDLAIWSRAITTAEMTSFFNLSDDFVTNGNISGTLKDRRGTTIDCSIYNVRINVYPKNNTVTAPVKTALITEAAGTWLIAGLAYSTKYLVAFEYEGAYTPLSENDIAGAEFITSSAG